MADIGHVGPDLSGLGIGDGVDRGLVGAIGNAAGDGIGRTAFIASA